MPDVFAEEDRVFVNAVLSGDASAIKSPYADAIKTMALTCAAEESMASGEPVHDVLTWRQPPDQPGTPQRRSGSRST